jgi:2'-5' RNA ligase
LASFGRLVSFKLFFAVFPDPRTAVYLEGLARQLRHEYRLNGRAFPARRFHCSLFACELDHRDDTWLGVIGKLQDAATRVTFPPFRIAFNGVGSSAHRDNRHPLVLVGDDGIYGATRLYSLLCAAIREDGFPCKDDPGFRPHVTMLYDRRKIGERAIEPVSWTVTEFILVLSLTGRSKYVLLQRWPLGANALNPAA